MDTPLRGPAPSQSRLRLLLVGIRQDDALLIVGEMQRGGYELTWERVDADGLAEALQRQPWDLITCDWEAPEFNAAAVLGFLRERLGEAAVVIAYGQGGGESAGAAMTAGACDFVSTSELARLLPAVQREMQHAEARRACKQAEDALRETQLHLDLALTGSNAGIWDWDLRTSIAQYSRGWRELLGYGEDEFAGDMEDWLKLVHPDDRESLAGYVLQYMSNPSPRYEVEFRVRDKNGADRYILSRARGILDAEGHPIRLVGMHVDITDRKRAEEAQREAAEVAAALAASGRRWCLRSTRLCC